MKKRVAVLGATGSIGKSTLDVLRHGRDDFEVVLLTSHTDVEGLLRLGAEFPSARLALSGYGPEAGQERITYFGLQGLCQALAECNGNITVNGIAGAAGLEPSLAVLKAGMDLALANKETLVMAAPLVFALAKAHHARILPVDSEHAAVFNLLEAHGTINLDRILLTASGGPFRNYSPEQLAAVTVSKALAHPTWSMGAKITIDSATLANKGLEVIEAARLFDLPGERIQVVVHPQSIVHSMVCFKDGTIYAQLSRPDMRLPIQDALYYPQRGTTSFGTLDFSALTLHFEPPKVEHFPLLTLAYQALAAGDPYPAVFNAANEIAVQAFLAEKASFLDIPRIVKAVLQEDWNMPAVDLASILETDRRARNMAGIYLQKGLHTYAS
ncbi:MAG: 1-deoxy-D-xylulose-5-phosphate reductoisomerase [Treponema sp.]|jgi:1-deoxy-D-xylulose-5-phosphate reductoisomerase|nr:1-deoxy-D-xylulose-5-phosphate reductoisomerase [Treponema sp.]